MPKMDVCAVVRLDGEKLGVCDSIDNARRVVDLAVKELSVEGGETTLPGELKVETELCAVSECLSVPELFKLLTKTRPLPVECVVVRRTTEIVPYETQIVKDPNAYECQTVIRQEGMNGEIAYETKEYYVGGELVRSNVLSYEVVTQVKNRIEIVGLLPKPEWWPTGTFIQPAQGKITSEFGKRRYEHHTGIDIANSAGNSVVAADGGTVLYAGWLGNYGRYVVIDHEGIYTCYAHNSKLLVSKGDHVVQGQEIAKMGSSGRSTGSHCHFEIHDGNEFLQPRDFIDFVESERT